MFSWVRRYQKAILGILLLIITLQLIAWDIKEGGFWNMPSRILVRVSLVPLKAAGGAARGLKAAGEWFHQKKTLLNENDDLRREVAELKAERRDLEEILRENIRLRSLLRFTERQPYATLLAHVIGEEPTNSFRTILIDKGKKDRLDRGLAVVTADGVVGQIVRTASSTSQVLLMTDANSSVDVLIERSRAKGILTGWRGDMCQIKFLARTEDVKEGDRVITSGLGGVFPKGLDVGTVEEAEKKSWGIFRKAYVSPSVDFGKLEEVLVVRESGLRLQDNAGEESSEDTDQP